MKLTPNFSLWEFTHSDTAKKLGIENQPTDDELRRVTFSAIQMEIIRVILSNRPITITSGFRNARVNRAVGGSNTSDHRSGLAVDFKCSGMTGSQIASIVSKSKLNYDQIIDYGTARIHIGFGARNRRRNTLYKNGRYIDVQAF